MKIIILLNPAAGRRRGRRKFRRALEALRRLGVQPEIRESRDARHLVELARRATDERPDVVVSAGGDGTHHYVLNGLAGSEVPLGLLSLGSGNDLANGLGIPTEPVAAAETLLRGQARPIDLARAGGADGNPSEVYGCMAGVGFDTVVTRFANEQVRWVHGSAAYAWAIVRCLKFYRAHRLELTSDGGNFSDDFIFATIGNNTTYGGGLKMAPRARLDDGLLDVCIVQEMGKFELLRWVPRAYRGEHLAHPRILYFQARKISLESPSRLELFGDGEFMQELPVTIEAVPRALRVIVPKNSDP